jgi:hypothetical protein
MSYESVILADGASFAFAMDEASGNLTDLVGALTGTANGSPTYGQTGPVTGHTAIYMGSASDYFAVGDDNALDLGSGGFSIEAWYAKDGGLSTWDLFLSKIGTGGYWIGWNSGDHPALGRNGTGQLAAVTTGYSVDGVWRHYVWTVAPSPSTTGDYKCYINGVLQTLSYEDYANALSDTAGDLQINAAGDPISGRLAYVAGYKSVLTGAQIAAHYAAATATGPTWTTPADTVTMSTTPDLKFDSPTSGVAQHFQLQLDTANTFDTGNLRTYDSSTDQTNWTYYNGGSWVAIPSTGMPSAYSGNEVNLSVTSALTATTWYRRVRAGTLE